jgi:hypothetical protein
MALLSDMDITVCQRRVDSGSYKQSSSGSGGQRKTKVSAKTKYLVVVAEKSGGPSLAPTDLNPLLIINHPSIPRIGRTCYSFGGLIAPFLLCSNKTIDRDAENPFVFHVSVDWESIEVGVGGGSSQVGEETPQEALEPKPEEEFDTVPDPVASFTTSSTEVVLYEAYFVSGDHEKRQSWKLPTGTPFQEPVTRKAPLVTISITQFEDDITVDDLRYRSFSVNQERWNSWGTGQWLIAEVQAEEVTLNLQGGEVDMWRVTYTIHLAPYNPVNVVVDNEPALGPGNIGQSRGELFFPGWATLRPLVDTFYKKEGPDGPSAPDILVPNADEKTGYVEPCYIYEATGRKRTPTSTDGTGDDRPSYMAFMSYNYSGFDEFLQWP